MAKNLVIVESPAKARTIERFLGKEYVVKSSMGHIRDLPKKGLNIDIPNKFEPTYAVSTDKKRVVSELKIAAKDAEVWLASDEDREGEAIAWHLTQALKLDPKTTKRIVFHEITKPAIEAAIKSPRTIDLHLVDAQQARRVLDRLVGYELSPVLWKKVRTGLSAGRVQTVAVRLIVEREREIQAFKPDSSFKVSAVFTHNNDTVPAELNTKPTTHDNAKVWLEGVKSASYKVAAIEQKPGLRSPGAPFTTSTLQQEASRRLGFSVRQTMTLAQRLYENGDITYMRTDSTILSGLAIAAAKDFITKEYGANYHKLRQFKTKNESAQEAHEAIRPTDFNRATAGDEPGAQRLYQLIWQRAIASQMSEANIEKTEVTIDISGHQEKFVAKGEVLKFDGFIKVYGGGKDDVLLPNLAVGDILQAQTIIATETFSRPPARYSEAALVKKLEELGIGRPSTYAPTISTIQTRGYIEKKDLEGSERIVQILKLQKDQITEENRTEITGADRGKLVPTPIADVTTDFLVKNFPVVTSYDFTAQVEEEFDDIAEGKKPWNKMISEFYDGFHEHVEAAEDVSREEASQAREVGKDPKTGKLILARFGRYGPMLQRGETESDDKPDFAPLPKDTTIDTITLEQALDALKLPRVVGQTEDGQEIKAAIGRFGPYIQVGKLYVSLKEHDPYTVNEAEARELYKAKLAAEAAKTIQDFGKIRILNGPYGPYITDGKKNARIDKSTDPAKLTEAEATALLAAAPAKKRFVRRRAKK